ncbi:DUF4124 domain-containing protein [Methylococcus sp. EFPC2]|uniref:DUF4124 domain-containing protein n=1 Tax=Methylococcus sp. EFPC2 TaxID=2812648 RepID=UPI001968413F|nr:DUF4124 domain-containing protein [Methylococcus sp. EFPC2]QSA98813.1 DUF4124 domain-containing protein [Methylococcus sp. EFPC2]
MKRGLILLLAFSGQALAGEMYKWTDKSGTLHYTQTPPPAGAEVEKTITYDEEMDYRRQMRDLAVQREMEQETRRRIGGDIEGSNYAPQPVPQYAPQPVQQPGLSYSDKQQLKQIERDIERLSSSGIGDPGSRQQQIQALQRQQELIYSKSGAQASPQVIINRTRARNY